MLWKSQCGKANPLLPEAHTAAKTWEAADKQKSCPIALSLEAKFSHSHHSKKAAANTSSGHMAGDLLCPLISLKEQERDLRLQTPWTTKAILARACSSSPESHDGFQQLLASSALDQPPCRRWGTETLLFSTSSTKSLLCHPRPISRLWLPRPPAFQHAHVAVEEACLISSLNWFSLGGKRQHTVPSMSLFRAIQVCSHMAAPLQPHKPQWAQNAKAPARPNASFHHLQPRWIKTCRTILIVLVPMTKYLPGWATKVQSPGQKSCTERGPQCWDLSCRTRASPLPSAPRGIWSPQYLQNWGQDVTSRCNRRI